MSIWLLLKCIVREPFVYSLIRALLRRAIIDPSLTLKMCLQVQYGLTGGHDSGGVFPGSTGGTLAAVVSWQNDVGE
jgi:hypothetical protein